MHRFRICPSAGPLALALLLASPAVLAQPAAPAEPLMSTPDACKREYVKFEEAIGLLRRTQGNEAAAAVKEKLLPAKLETELLLNEGYCGLARYLREKKLR